MLQWADNFSFYGSGAAGVVSMLNGLPYAFLADAGFNNISQLPTDPDGISSGRVLVICGTNDNSNLQDGRMAVPTPVKTLGHGARFFRTSLPSNINIRPVIIGYRSPANGRMYDLIVEPNGALTVYNGAGTILCTTTIPIFTTNTWQHIEMLINSVTGAIEVRREGVVVLTGVEAVPQNALIGIIGWTNRQNFNFNNAIELYMKGLTIWDTTGTYNNTFMGTVSIVGCLVQADVSNAGWVPSTGASVAALLGKNVPDDSTFDSAAAINADVVMSLADLAADVTSVRGIVAVVRAKKNDGGDARITTYMKSAAAVRAGTEHAVGPATAYWWDVFEEDPNTVSPWTPGTFNSAQLRIKRTV